MSDPKQLPITKPLFGPEEAAEVAKSLKSGWVTQGPRVQEFETLFAERTGAAHAIAVSNCTVALELTLRAAGVGPGDVVVTVSHSFIATANAIRMVGAEPVFVDIGLDDLNMSPEALRDCIERDFEARDGGFYYKHTSRVATGESPLARMHNPLGKLAAILAVHQVGTAARLGELLSVAESAGVPLLEDAACAIGADVSFDRGASFEPIGKPHGLAASFSFHPRKVITTGEGGMITTNDDELAERFRLLRHHGMGISDVTRHKSKGNVESTFLITATNGRLSDIHGAIGVCQMARLDSIVTERRRLAALYSAGLDGMERISAPARPAHARSNWQSYIALLDADVDRKQIQQSLATAGISTRGGIMNSHQEPPYARQWQHTSFPNSETAMQRGLTLPLYPGMDDSDVDRVLSSLSSALK